MKIVVVHPDGWKRVAGDVVDGAIDSGIWIFVEDPVRAPDLSNIGKRTLAAPPGETLVVDRANRRTTPSGWPFELVCAHTSAETRIVAVYQLAEWVATVVVRARGVALDAEEVARVLESVRPDWRDIVALAQLFT